jgi:hypothetical protein
MRARGDCGLGYPSGIVLEKVQAIDNKLSAEIKKNGAA